MALRYVGEGANYYDDPPLVTATQVVLLEGTLVLFLDRQIMKAILIHSCFLSVDILWKGNPITCMETYETNHCVLCMEERCAILKQWKKDNTTSSPT